MFQTPTAVFRADDFAASCLRGALPPVDLRAVCLVRAIGNDNYKCWDDGGQRDADEDPSTQMRHWLYTDATRVVHVTVP